MSLFKSNKSGAHQWRGVIEEYRDRLPVSAKTPVVSLREGVLHLFMLAISLNFWAMMSG